MKKQVKWETLSNLQLHESSVKELDRTLTWINKTMKKAPDNVDFVSFEETLFEWFWRFNPKINSEEVLSYAVKKIVPELRRVLTPRNFALIKKFIGGKK